jgi:3-hydroxyanthranilate 3,4-dioxygenase
MFLLPPRVWHSPRRYADTLGIVWERERGIKESDGFRWFACDSNEEEKLDMTVLHEQYFHCTDLGTQLKPILEAFFNSKACQTRTPNPGMPISNPPCIADGEVERGIQKPFNLATALKHLPPGGSLEGGKMSATNILPPGEFELCVFKGCMEKTPLSRPDAKEIMFWGGEGQASVRVGASQTYTVKAGEVLYITLDEDKDKDQGDSVVVEQADASAVLWCVWNRNYFDRAGNAR